MSFGVSKISSHSQMNINNTLHFTKNKTTKINNKENTKLWCNMLGMRLECSSITMFISEALVQYVGHADSKVHQ